jgi:predicted PurR-regulated permease PerM
MGLTDSQKWLILALSLLGGGLMYLLSPVLMPFVFSAILAYLGDPLTDKLETYRLSRTQAVGVVFTLMILLLLLAVVLLIPQVDFQIGGFISSLPAYAQKINSELLPWLQQRFGLVISPVNIEEIVHLLQTNWQKAGGIAAKTVDSISRSGGVIASVAMNLLLIPVVTFYLLRDWDALVAKIYRLLPRRIAPITAKLASEVNLVLSAFLRGQFYVMLALGFVYSIGLGIIGLDLALLIGMLAGFISFVPYLGAIVGFVAACIAAGVQFHDFMPMLWVGLVFMIGQTLEGTVLTPKLVGDKIGLHPVAVIFSVMAGGQLFGFLGVLLALPVASIIMVFL